MLAIIKHGRLVENSIGCFSKYLRWVGHEERVVVRRYGHEERVVVRRYGHEERVVRRRWS